MSSLLASSTSIVFMLALLSASVSSIQANPIATSSTETRIGGWVVGGLNKQLTLNNPPFSEAKLFQLACVELEDSSRAHFSFTTENRQYIQGMSEAGASILEATQLTIKQTAEGEPQSCQVRISSRQPGETLSINWLAYTGERVMLAGLIDGSELQLDLHKPINRNCGGVEVLLNIDGKQVVDIDNKVMKLLLGTSFFGFGRVVDIQISGRCSESIAGTLNIYF